MQPEGRDDGDGRGTQAQRWPLSDIADFLDFKRDHFLRRDQRETAYYHERAAKEIRRLRDGLSAEAELRAQLAAAVESNLELTLKIAELNTQLAAATERVDKAVDAYKALKAKATAKCDELRERIRILKAEIGPRPPVNA